MDQASFRRPLYNMHSSVYALRLIITFHFFSRTILSYSPLWNSAAAAICDCNVAILLRHIWSRILLSFFRGFIVTLRCYHITAYRVGSLFIVSSITLPAFAAMVRHMQGTVRSFWHWSSALAYICRHAARHSPRTKRPQNFEFVCNHLSTTATTTTTTTTVVFPRQPW